MTGPEGVRWQSRWSQSARAGREPILYMCVAKGPLLDAATLNLRGAKQARPEGGRTFAALQVALRNQNGTFLFMLRRLSLARSVQFALVAVVAFAIRMEW